MQTKRFNSIHLLAISVICVVTTVVIYWKINKANSSDTSDLETIQAQSSLSCETEAHRLAGYTFIQPLLYSTKTCESGSYANLKKSIAGVIEQYRQSGNIDKVSVYLKLLSNREYVAINENDMYHPASLIKLPILITFLEMEEKKPGTLNKQLVFHLPKGGVPQQTYNTKQIVPEKSYSIKELLTYMIAYSDNNATYVLNKNVDVEAFKKMFSDLGLIVPDVRDQNYQISAKDYSVFLNIIYNAGYLTISNSEFVAELLNECDFKEGIQKGLPEGTKLVHKFGEWGDRKNPLVHQLSESAIIYLGKTAYILTIMSQGKDVKILPHVLSDISKTIYTYLNADAANL